MNLPAPTPPPDPATPYGAYYGSPPPATSGPQLRRYLSFLARKWYLVVLSLALFASLAAAYIIYWPMSYVSTGHMWAAGKIGLQLREGATYNEEGQNFAGTQVELIQSDKIMQRAFNRVQTTLRVNIPTNSEGKPELVTIKVSQLPKSAVLELKAKGPTELYTRAFLDATMDEFLAYKKEIRSATSGDTYTSVSEQISKQEADLKASQEKLTTYMRDNNVAVLEEQAKAASAYLTQLLAEFSQLKVEHQLLEAMSPVSDSQLSTLNSELSHDLRPLSSATTRPPPEFLGAQQELEKVKIMRDRLNKYLRPEHPKIVKLDEEISRGEKLVEFFSKQSRDQLLNAKQTVKLKLDRVQETIKEWETKVNDASVRIAEYQRQKLEVERLQSLNDRLLGLLQTVDVTRNLDQENITILDRASETKPGKRSTSLLLALSLFAGLGAGLALVFFVEHADDRLLSLYELTARFEEWIIGQIPEVPNAKKKKQPALLDVKDTRHMFAESWRNLRSALLYLPMPGDRPKVLLITSAIPNEGKSTIAANLARALAFGGSRVLLVDGDFRKGALDKLLELKREPGLSDYLSNGTLDPTQFTVQIPITSSEQGAKSKQQGAVSSQEPISEISNLNSQLSASSPLPARGSLSFISRGTNPNNPGDLFLSLKLDETLQRWRKEYDYVLIDTCPVFASDDATTLAPKVDGTLFVVRGRLTRASVAREALDLLYARQAKVLGLVFNRADSASSSYKYYKYKDYHQAATKT